MSRHVGEGVSRLHAQLLTSSTSRDTTLDRSTAPLRPLVALLLLAGLTAGFARAQGQVPAEVVAHMQLIHNALDLEAVDLYVNGHRVADDAGFQTATVFLRVPAGEARIDVVAAGDADNSNPLLSQTLTVFREVNYVAVVAGRQAELQLLVQDKIRLVSSNNDLEYIFVHGSPDLGELDVRILDPVSSNSHINALLVNNLSFGGILGYQALAPAGYNLQVTNADNTVEYEVFRLELHFFGRQTLVFLTSGAGSKASDGFTLIGFDVLGNSVRASVITAAEGAEDVPAAFVLEGNYPNPFNPQTTIRFDLPEAAEVSVEVVDVLGRTVLTVPAQRVEAGAGRSLRVDAGGLASGTYLYRLIARTAGRAMMQTGRMTLVR